MGMSNERLAEVWVFHNLHKPAFKTRNKRKSTTLHYVDDVMYLSFCNTPMARIFTPKGKQPYVVIARHLPEHAGHARIAVARGADSELHDFPRAYWNEDRKDIYYVNNIFDPDWRAEIQHWLDFSDWRRQRASRMRDRHNITHQIAWASKEIAIAQRISETFNVHVPGLYGPDI